MRSLLSEDCVAHVSGFRPKPAVRAMAAAQSGAPLLTQSPTQFLDPVARLLAALRQGEVSDADFALNSMHDAIHPNHEGRITVPQGAGLGIDPDPAVVAKLRVG